MNTKIIKFDLNKNLYDTLIAKQGDTKSRFLLFNLLDGSIPFSLENRSVRVYAIKPDKTEVFNDLIITDAAKGYCVLELTTQMLAVSGTIKLELMVIEGDKKLTSNIFYMDVKKSINSEKAIVSTNEFGALLTALASLNEYDNYKNEIKNARGGQVNLKTRLDNFDEQLDKIENNIEVNYAKKDDVSKISSGTPLFASSTTEMSDITRNYVNTTDGYLYIYSDGQWSKTGILYQSTGLSDNSVEQKHLKYKGLYMNKELDYPLENLNGYKSESSYNKVKKSILDIKVHDAKDGCKYKLNYVGNNTNTYGYLILISRIESDGTEKSLIKTEKISDSKIIPNSVNKVIRYANTENGEDEWFEFIIDYSEITSGESLDLTYLGMTNNRICVDKINYKEKEIYKNCFTYYKSTNEIRISGKYSDNYDVTILFNKFGVNKLMSINGVFKKLNKAKNPKITYSESDVLYCENTDWLSPYQLKAIANWDETQTGDAWTGGSHAYKGVTGEPTAQTKLFRITVDGKEITTTTSDLMCNKVIIEVINEIEARNTHNDNKRYVMEEKVRYTIIGNKVDVEVKHHLKEDLEWSIYYSLQTPSNFYNEIKFYDGEVATDYVSYNDSATRLSGNKLDFPFVDTRIMRKNNDYLKVFVDTNFGIGDRSLLADTSSNMITGTYQKTYSPLIMGKTQLVKANTNIFWRGYYEFWCLD